MNCSEVKFYEHYLTSDFHSNTVISRRVCLPVKMASGLLRTLTIEDTKAQFRLGAHARARCSGTKMDVVHTRQSQN